MKKPQAHPKFKRERERLLARIETYKGLIKEDLAGLKESVRPLAIAKDVIHQAADSFRDKSVATEGTRLALTLLPGRLQSRVIGTVAQVAVPMIMKNMPGIVDFVSDQAPKFKKSRILGGLRKAVHGLRERLTKDKDIKPDDLPFKKDK